MKKIKYRLSRFVAWLSPSFLWRRLFLYHSHWDDAAAQRRLLRYVRSGVRVRILRYPISRFVIDCALCRLMSGFRER